MSLTGLRETFDRRGTKFGCGVLEFATPGIGHILKQGGCDFAFVDMEHSGLGIDTVKQVMRYMEAADLPAFVRPPSDQYHDIARLLDIGVEGILLPMVASAEQAKHIVDCMKYPPTGKRGVAMGHGGDRWRPVAQRQGQRDANRRTVPIMLIETAEGIDNVEAIAAVKGVDVLWIGHSDLSASLGIPGEFSHPRFRAAVAKVVAAARRHKLHLGRLTRNVAESRQMIRQGFDLICYSADSSLLREALTSSIDAIRGKGGGGRKK